MPRHLVHELPGLIGTTVSLCGWADTLRLQRAMQFVVLRDATGSVQLVHERGGEGDVLAATLDSLRPETVLRARGRVVDAPRVKLGGLEVVVDEVEILNPAEQPLPMDASSGPDVRADFRFLDLRSPANQLLFRVATAFEDGMRATARALGFVELHSPKLMAAASESGADVFRVEYFDREAFLAQSPQFYKQMAIAGGLDRVFEVGPVFRAEPSFTTRHATEFTGIDAELAWIDGVEDVMEVEEAMLVGGIRAVGDAWGAEVTRQFGVEVTVPERPFPRITHAEALDLLAADSWAPPDPARPDLDPAGERRLSELVAARYGHGLVFVTAYPAGLRPFYHHRPAGTPGLTASFDLLWKGVEVTTGAQREHRHDVLVSQAEELGVDTSSLRHYLDCFRYGCPPHGGFGLGLERTLMVLLDRASIRETSFLARTPNRLVP